jgi:hypothetical protein
MCAAAERQPGAECYVNAGSLLGLENRPSHPCRYRPGAKARRQRRLFAAKADVTQCEPHPAWASPMGRLWGAFIRSGPDLGIRLLRTLCRIDLVWEPLLRRPQRAMLMLLPTGRSGGGPHGRRSPMSFVPRSSPHGTTSSAKEANACTRLSRPASLTRASIDGWSGHVTARR